MGRPPRSMPVCRSRAKPRGKPKRPADAARLAAFGAAIWICHARPVPYFFDVPSQPRSRSDRTDSRLRLIVGIIWTPEHLQRLLSPIAWCSHCWWCLPAARVAMNLAWAGAASSRPSGFYRPRSRSAAVSIFVAATDRHPASTLQSRFRPHLRLRAMDHLSAVSFAGLFHGPPPAPCLE